MNSQQNEEVLDEERFIRLFETDLYTIFEGLVSKKDYQMEYFKFSTKGQLVITIKASIDSYDKEQLKLAAQIRNDVKAALDKEYTQPYTIQILGINNEPID